MILLLWVQKQEGFGERVTQNRIAYIFSEDKTMPRPMLRTPQTQAQSNNLLSATFNKQQQEQHQQMDKVKLDWLLRRSRSKAYMDALHKLDVGGHVHNQNKVNEIINTIKSESPEIELNGILLGYVAICYLGKPYEVHTLDITGGIIEHYKAGHILPNGLEKARKYSNAWWV